MTQKKILINMFMKAYSMDKKEAKIKVDRVIEDVLNKEMNIIENIRFDTEGSSLFNSHVNNAANRAMKDMVHKYGQDVYDAYIGKYKESGIMAIMGQKDGFTSFYINKVHEYANGTWDY